MGLRIEFSGEVKDEEAGDAVGNFLKPSVSVWTWFMHFFRWKITIHNLFTH
jgi:hypothetical protein